MLENTMEEVRSYWQVASITHFCTLFNKPFKLPTFEPEELEQAFIIDVPETPKSSNNHINSNQNDDSEQQQQRTNSRSDDEQADHNTQDSLSRTNSVTFDEVHPQQPNQTQYNNHQQNEEPQELHLLVKLAIALLKPHFNCKLSLSNWENYLRRIVDTNWVELEHHPSPFRIPIISPDGVELTKNLTFNELSLSDKIDLFYALCDYRFWCEDASEAIKDYLVEELRLESIGKDSQGYEYWYFSGTRLFREDRELTQDLILRKKRVKELEYTLIDLEKARIIREQEERRKLELEKAKQLANEAREARLAAKRQQQEQETLNKKRRNNTPLLPPRTGLRERRSSAASNNNDSQSARTPTTRSKVAKQQPNDQPVASTQKATRSSAKNSRNSDEPQNNRNSSPELPAKTPEEECKEELERIAIKPENRMEAWSVQCDSLESWESFASSFEKTKSINEKYLSSYINEEILPKIRAIYAKRAAEVRRKEKELLLSLSSRRVSTRISRRAQEEEEERQAQQRELDLRKKQAEAEEQLRAELEREMRKKKNRFVINGETTSACNENGGDDGRYNLRQNQEIYDSSNDFEGVIHPDRLTEFYEALELIIDTVRTSKHAWPFVDSVPETVPGYYDLIEEPMDLKKLRCKVEFRKYKSLIEVEKDFQLLVNNCEKFNGPKNVYTKMVYKLWKSFRKNVRLYLQRDLNMDEHETFIYPPPKPPNSTSDLTCSTQNGVSMNHTDEKVALQEQVEDTKTTENDIMKQESLDVEMMEHKEVSKNNIQMDTCAAKVEVKMQILESATNKCDITSGEKGSDEEVMMVTKSDPLDPPEPIGEEIIIDSYDVPCPDETFFIWPQEIKSEGHKEN